MGQPPVLVSGGNVASHDATRYIKVKWLRARGGTARLLRRYLNAGTQSGLSYTGVYEYRRFPSRMFMFNFRFGGKKDTVDSLEDAIVHVLGKHPSQCEYG